ncbi:hypothetical protein GGD89_000063 [Roseospira visakhapatnamensis]|uniref:Uncharacterized protein n=1 Tax=Roseospira visakhapatnamensis TaxID=390880 RepID=A0A7W6R9P4_9PROT|nr:hypothetical protein [Roseospira visakhapatnamensis]
MQQDGRRSGSTRGGACGPGKAWRTEALVSDEDVVRATHETALANGACAPRAWRAAVGAYLERHPGISVYTAERIVSAVMRPVREDEERRRMTDGRIIGDV